MVSSGNVPCLEERLSDLTTVGGYQHKGLQEPGCLSWDMGIRSCLRGLTRGFQNG